MIHAEAHVGSPFPVRVFTPVDQVPMTTDEAKKFLLDLADAIRSAESRKPIKTIPIVEVRNERTASH